MDILNQNSFYMNNVDFWGHSDADMMEIGNNMPFNEARTHFALWVAMKSPILLGTALDKLDQDNLSILKNKYLLAFHQDGVYGKPAMPYKWGTNPDWTFNSSFPAEYWSGTYQNGTLVWLFNPYDDTVEKKADFSEIPQLHADGSYTVYDAWTGENLGCQRYSVSRNVSSHDTAVLLVKCGCEPQLEKKGFSAFEFDA